MLAHNLEWKLRPGVNLAPSVNGDTCLVEAAIIAAGLKYREVWVASECPRCFSRPVTQYAIDINTLMPERMRETLLPFVLMLGHSADDSEVENKRYEFIFDQTFVKLMLP